LIGVSSNYSALSGENVNELFVTLAEILRETWLASPSLFLQLEM
jgi:hypothetical protein